MPISRPAYVTVQVSYDAEIIFNEGELYARVVWGWELLDSLREDHLSATARSMIRHDTIDAEMMQDWMHLRQHYDIPWRELAECDARALAWLDIKKDVIS